MNTNEMDMETLEELMENYPAKLVTMMYEKAINCLHETIAAIEAGDIKTRFARTTRVADIIEVLHASLDKREGGEIAANLDQLYTYVITQLPMINISSDVNLVRGLIDILTPLRDSWSELDERICHDLEEAEKLSQAFSRYGAGVIEMPLAGAA